MNLRLFKKIYRELRAITPSDVGDTELMKSSMTLMELMRDGFIPAPKYSLTEGFQNFYETPVDRMLTINPWELLARESFYAANDETYDETDVHDASSKIDMTMEFYDETP